MSTEIKIGISGFAWTARFEASHLDLFPLIKDMGFDGFEVPMFNPADLPVGKIGAAIAELDLDCSICAILPPQVNPISPDAEVRRKAIDHLGHCIEATAEMGCKILGGPLFSPIGYLPGHRPTVAEWSWAIDAFQSVSELLHAADVHLSIEPVNRSETFFLRTGMEARKLCEAIGSPRIGVTIDTFHANIEERSIPEAIRTLGPHLKHIHASENDRGPVGSGHVPFAEIISALRAMSYNGYLMIEGFGYNPEDQHAPGYLWATPEVTPEALATQSYKCLRQILDQED